MSGWTSSPDIDEFAPAYVAALAEFSEIEQGKTARIPTKTGGTFSYSYAALEDILPVIRPILAKNGLGVFQSAGSAQGVVSVVTTIMHTSGQWLRFDPLCLGSGSDAQSAGSAITYARRYTLLPALGMATEDDDGGAAMQGNPPSRTAPAAVAGKPEPTFRSPEEAVARGILDALPPDEVKGIRAAFREQFGCTLAQLPRDRHQEALDYIRFLAEGRVGGDPTKEQPVQEELPAEAPDA